MSNSLGWDADGVRLCWTIDSVVEIQCCTLFVQPPADG